MKKKQFWVHAASLFCMSSSFSHGVYAGLRHESLRSEYKKRPSPKIVDGLFCLYTIISV